MARRQQDNAPSPSNPTEPNPTIIMSETYNSYYLNFEDDKDILHPKWNSWWCFDGWTTEAWLANFCKEVLGWRMDEMVFPTHELLIQEKIRAFGPHIPVNPPTKPTTAERRGKDPGFMDLGLRDIGRSWMMFKLPPAESNATVGEERIESILDDLMGVTDYTVCTVQLFFAVARKIKVEVQKGKSFATEHSEIVLADQEEVINAIKSKGFGLDLTALLSMFVPVDMTAGAVAARKAVAEKAAAESEEAPAELET
ncbi:hypothetical protein K491DRAFT_717293 [Lophiostoma macrostomum CBS 122681]|uniref:Uncharacterized protein n=1 Tax=Lophiostoma macrostomum CBS 122681 TaxID=1314788 RepID=A0A6A6T4Y1_9PLEO|nr:hypothetical protein K491DRAFT_717293 [Lophiostoma macrostomum CBS 122681]